MSFSEDTKACFSIIYEVVPEAIVIINFRFFFWEQMVPAARAVPHAVLVPAQVGHAVAALACYVSCSYN